MPIDQFIEEELDMAREQRREKSRKLKLGMSERVLYEFSKDQQPDLFTDGENLKETVMAARGYKDWRSFAMCGFKVA
jgi:hypothetical protein